MPYDWDQVIASSRDNWFPWVAEGVYETDPLFRVMFRQDRELVRTTGAPEYIRTGGGPNLRWTATVAKPTVETVKGFKVLNTIQPNQFRSVSLPWAHYVTAISVDQDTEDANMGEQQVFDLVRAMLDNGRKALGEMMAIDIYADGTAPDATERLASLQVAAHVSNTYATVNRDATTTWWNSKVYRDAGGEEPSLTKINEQRITLSDADVVPDLILTSKKIFNKLWSQAFPNQQLSDRDDPMIGWEHISLGRTRITWSKYCPADHVYYLSFREIRIVVHEGAEFDLLPEVRSPNQLAWTRFLRWKGQLMVINPVWVGREFNYSTA